MGAFRRKTLNRVIGAAGEEAAADYLRRQGYRILERNYACRAGEIDIIAEHQGEIAFIEVKTRSPRALLAPIEAVDDEKQQRVRKAAKYYLSNFKAPSPTRFDIVSVRLNELDAVSEIELQISAF